MNEAIQKQNKDIEQMEYFKPITKAIKEQPTPQPPQPITHNYLAPALNYEEKSLIFPAEALEGQNQVTKMMKESQ